MQDACKCNLAHKYLYEFEDSSYKIFVEERKEDRYQQRLMSSLRFWQLGGKDAFHLIRKRSSHLSLYEKETLGCISYLNRVNIVLSSLSSKMSNYDSFAPACVVVDMERKKLCPFDNTILFDINNFLKISQEIFDKRLEPFLRGLKDLLLYYHDNQEKGWRECLLWIGPNTLNKLFDRATGTLGEPAALDKQIAVKCLSHLICIWNTTVSLCNEEPTMEAGAAKFNDIVNDPLVISNFVRRIFTRFQPDDYKQLEEGEIRKYTVVLFDLFKSGKRNLRQLADFIFQDAQENRRETEGKTKAFYEKIISIHDTAVSN